MLIYWHHWWASGCIFLIPSLQAFIYIDKIPFYLLFLLQTFFLVSGTWNFWGQVLLVKTKVEKALSVSAYSIPFVTISVLPFSSRPTFSPAFLLLQINLKEPFVLPWQIQLWVGFGFPDPITAHLDSVSIFPLGAHLFSVSSLCLSIVRSSLLVHADLLSHLLNFLHVEMTTLDLGQGDPWKSTSLIPEKLTITTGLIAALLFWWFSYLSLFSAFLWVGWFLQKQDF